MGRSQSVDKKGKGFAQELGRRGRVGREWGEGRSYWVWMAGEMIEGGGRNFLRGGSNLSDG